MKTSKKILTVILLTLFCGSLPAQPQEHLQKTSTKTESFKVWGQCNMCKTRIEKTLKLEGINKVSWDEKSQLATVTYDPSKTNIDIMQKKLASVGHDTEKYKAPDDVYASLPGCCHYDRSK